MPGETVLYEKDGRIAHIILNRPERLNAFTAPMRQELSDALDLVTQDPEVRVAILKGAGRSFSSGADLGGGGGGSGDVATDEAGLRASVALYLKIWDLPKPIIAQVHGYCMGIATQMAIFCDITMVADDTKVGWPVLPVGGGFIGPMWAWLVGPKHAKEGSFIAGKLLTGTEATAMGWANHAIPASTLEAETLKMAREIAKVPSDILRLKKLAINQMMEIQGFRTAVNTTAEFNAIAHYSTAVENVRQKMRELTWKGAVEEFNENGF